MKVLRAEHLGMCFGVRDAIRMAIEASTDAPLTVLGELVHNAQVLQELREQGIGMEQDPERVKTPRAMITAHGASQRLIERCQAAGLWLLDGTCPLVRGVHQALQSLVRMGYHPVVIGVAGHAEVRGMTEDLDAFDVVLNETDVDGLAERKRFGIVAQTTQPIDRVRHLVALIRRRFPQSEVRFMDTVCVPTKQRQTAAIDLAREVEVMIVIGGAHSNNTRELASTCRRHCQRVYQVQNDGELRMEWFKDVQSVGITAGTSTPDSVIDAVERQLCVFSRQASALVAA